MNESLQSITQSCSVLLTIYLNMTTYFKCKNRKLISSPTKKTNSILQSIPVQLCPLCTANRVVWSGRWEYERGRCAHSWGVQQISNGLCIWRLISARRLPARPLYLRREPVRALFRKTVSHTIGVIASRGCPIVIGYWSKLRPSPWPTTTPTNCQQVNARSWTVYRYDSIITQNHNIHLEIICKHSEIHKRCRGREEGLSLGWLVAENLLV